ncbi:MAG: transcription antitermination factor NusB [Endomicrobium sp.]|jgi:transcription antitermination factor NusB|nr:transcription antitermination factor NusB [Endomicrobium sp.]
MSTRREARECSLKMLYALDNFKTSIENVYSFFSGYLPKSEAYRTFAVNLFKGVCDNRETIDNFIKRYAKNWEIERMAVVDRNIMRIAVYEIMTTPNTPVNVVINEAVEISKRYSTKDSAKFVNGILDRLKILRENREPQE